MANEEPSLEEDSLEEYWEMLRPKFLPPKKKIRSSALSKSSAMTREELDEAILARSAHLRNSPYYQRRMAEDREAEELRQAVLDRAPHMEEWVVEHIRREDHSDSVK